MRVTTIDFEASGLWGVPIEVGTATWDRDAGTIATWSTLVRPIPAWEGDERLWDPAADRVHRIPRDDLASGLDPDRVLDLLNGRFAGETLFCDGGAYDDRFLMRLALAAGGRHSFRLGSVRHLALAVGLDQGGRTRAADLYEAAERAMAIAHRAGPDALALLTIMIEAAGLPPAREVAWPVSERGTAGGGGDVR